MTQRPTVIGPGTDVHVLPADVADPDGQRPPESGQDRPATSDPAEFVDGDHALGGMGGDVPGGAG